MSRGRTPSEFSPATTSDSEDSPSISAKPIPGSCVISACVRGTTTVFPGEKGFGCETDGASRILRVRLPCDTATCEIRTSSPMTIVPDLWSMTTRAAVSGSIVMFSIWPTSRAGLILPRTVESIETVPESTRFAKPRPSFRLIAASIRAAVVKSGFRNAKRIFVICEKSKGTSRSTRAPEGMVAVVGTPWTTEADIPDASAPPARTAPWATAYISPSAAFKGVITNVPPSRLFASPIAATPTSICEPARAKGGSVAVTITAATFFGRNDSSATLTPSRSSRPAMISSVKGEFLRLSPEPLRPTTNPYPTRSFPLTPSTFARSLIRTGTA